MDKIAVVGDRDSILGFKALGLEIQPVTEKDQPSMIINRLAREDYAVIFVTEKVAAQVPDTLQRYKSSLKPAIILIPDNQGSTGLAMQRLSQDVERAIGMNLFMNEEGE